MIAHIELRSEDDPEIVPYTHQRQIDIVVCEQGVYSGIQAVRKQLNELIDVHLRKLVEYGIMQCDGVSGGIPTANDVNFLHVVEAEK